MATPQMDVAALQATLTSAIRAFVAQSPLNRFRDIDGSPIWDEPLVAFAEGDDELFERYKTVVHDKVKCRQFVFETMSSWAKKPGYIGSYASCGLCQTGVPCEAGIPTARV